jgi:protein TonB
VALEVPVTVNGARAVDGSDKREPFSETTKTVLVFGNGAVIRLTSTVAAGQLLFLTNEKTKKEVVCQVVKSKNYRSVSGYVELEFTEAVVGFWGMRFPGDRIGPQPVTTNSAATSPVSLTPPPAPKIEARIPLAPPQVEAKPAAPAVVKSFEHLKPQMPAAKIETPIAANRAPAAPAESNVITIPSLPKIQSVTPVQATQSTKQSSSGDLKLETARLQEQLSAMLFADAGAASATHGLPSAPAIKTPIADTAAAIFEIAKSEPSPVAKAPVAVAKPAVPQAKSLSTLDDDEVQIPSWLQPLVRNAAAAPETTTPEPVSEEPTRLVEINEFESHEVAAAPTVASAASSAASSAPAFGGTLFEESPLSEAPSAKGGKGVLYAAIAAGVLLCVAGGAWYLRTSLNPGGSGAVAVNRPAEVAAAATAPAQQPAANHLPAAAATGAGAMSSQHGPAALPAATQQPQMTMASSKTNEVAPAQHALTAPTQPEPKKPSLGAVHLAAPTVSHKSNAADNAAPAFGMPGSEMAANTDALGGAGLVAGRGSQPAAPSAPIAIGGDVKTARPLSSARPVYPALARNQHVEGDVKIDALIDPTGRVTTMKVLSGPTLLQQAAMDALRQWKYQPATLDGKAVPMHLAVTIQFRLQ